MPFSQGWIPQLDWRRSEAPGQGCPRLHVTGPIGFSPGLRLGARTPAVSEHASLGATDSATPAYTQLDKGPGTPGTTREATRIPFLRQDEA